MAYSDLTRFWIIVVLMTVAAQATGESIDEDFNPCKRFHTLNPPGPYKVGDSVTVRVTLSGKEAAEIDRVYFEKEGKQQPMENLGSGIWEGEALVAFPNDARTKLQWRAYRSDEGVAYCWGDVPLEFEVPNDMMIQLDCPELAQPNTNTEYQVRIMGGKPTYTVSWDLDGEPREEQEANAPPTANRTWKHWMSFGDKQINVEVKSGAWFGPERKTASCTTRVVSDRLGVNIRGPRTLQVGEKGTWRLNTDWEPGLLISREFDFKYTVYWTPEKTLRYENRGQSIEVSEVFQEAREYVVDVLVQEQDHGYSGRGRFTVNVVEREPQPVSIEGPTNLDVGQAGTWKLKLMDGEGPFEYEIYAGFEDQGRKRVAIVIRQQSDQEHFEFRYQFDQPGEHTIAGLVTDRFGITHETRLYTVRVGGNAADAEDGFQIGATETRPAQPTYIDEPPAMLKKMMGWLHPEGPLEPDAPEDEWRVGETITRPTDDAESDDDDFARQPGPPGDGRRPPRPQPGQTRVNARSAAPYHIFAACSRLGWAGGLANYTQGASDEDIRAHLRIAGEHVEAAYNTSNEPIRAWPDWRSIQDKFSGLGNQLTRQPTRTTRRQLAATIAQLHGPLAERLAYQMAGEVVHAENCDSYYCRIGYQMANGQQLLQLAQQADLASNDAVRRNAEREGLDAIRQAASSLRNISNVKLASGTCANFNGISGQLRGILRSGSPAQRAQGATDAWQDALERLLTFRPAAPPAVARQVPPRRPPAPTPEPSQTDTPQRIDDPGELAGVWDERYGFRSGAFEDPEQQIASSTLAASVQFVKDGENYVGYKLTPWPSLRNQTKFTDLIKMEITYGRQIMPNTEVYRLRRTGRNSYVGEGMIVTDNRGLKWVDTEIVVEGDYAEERWGMRGERKLGFERKPYSRDSCIRSVCYNVCLDFGRWRGSLTDTKCKACQRSKNTQVKDCLANQG
jgi:hypothetical protein